MPARALLLVVTLLALFAASVLFFAGDDEASTPDDVARAEAVEGPSLDASSAPGVVGVERDVARETAIEALDTAVATSGSHMLVVEVVVGEQPLGGAEVDVFALDRHQRPTGSDLCDGATDAAGVLELAWWSEAPVATLADVVVRHPDHVPVRRRVRRVEGDVTSVRVVLETGAWLAGRLVDADGEPVPGKFQLLHAESTGKLLNWGYEGTKCTAGPDGGFFVAAPRLGTFALLAMSESKGLSPPHSVEVAAAGRTDLGEVRLGRASEVTGRVLLTDGTPVGDRDLVVEFERIDPPYPASGPMGPGLEVGWTRPTEDGRFAMEGLLPGRYSLTLTTFEDRWLADPIQVEAGTSGVEVLLDAWWLTVRAQAGSGELVPMKRLQFGVGQSGASRAKGGRGWGRIDPPFTSAKLVLPRSGTFLVECEQHGADVEHSFHGFVGPELPAGEHELVLREDDADLASLEIRLTGDPLPEDAELSAYLQPVDSGWPASTTLGRVGPSGVLGWNGIAPGRYSLRIDARSDWPRKTVMVLLDLPTEPLLFTAGRTETMTVGVRAAGLIELTFPGEEHSSSKAELSLRGQDDTWRVVSVTGSWHDGEGQLKTLYAPWFTLPMTVHIPRAFPAGVHELRIEAEGYQPHELEVDVNEGRVTRVEVSLDPLE